MSNNTSGQITMPANQVMTIGPSSCCGFTITAEQFATNTVAEKYEEIMYAGLLEIMRLTGTIDISSLSICSHRTKCVYEHKLSRLFGSSS